MRCSYSHTYSTWALAVLGTLACGGGGQSQTAGVTPAPYQPASVNTPSTTATAPRQRYTDADVSFMTGMIGHHAQAVLMAGWAPSHGASPSIQALCERIVVGQKDEIALMQRWLGERNKPVPEADASHDMMPGMQHSMMMPGMLTADQLMELDAARGTDFDRLFLKYMIQHHQGALTMVDQLMSSPGAVQDDNLFKFASDMNADQSIEIERMTGMLAALPA